MITREQLNAITCLMNLNRRQKSILDWKQRQIQDYHQLFACANDLKGLSDQGCLDLLNKRNPCDLSSSLHF